MMTTGGLSIRHLRVSRSLKSKVAETGRPQRLFLFSTTFRPSDAAGSSNVEGKWETGLLSWGRGVGGDPFREGACAPVKKQDQWLIPLSCRLRVG